MTIGSIAPKETKSRGKRLVDENDPLLPKRQEEEGGYDEFDGASFSGAVFNLSTTIVGAGIMALPATMKVLGLGVGVAMIIFMAFLAEASIELLLRFSRAGKTVSYGGLMGDAFGKYGKGLLQVCVLVNNIGVLIVYMIIIGIISFYCFHVFVAYFSCLKFILGFDIKFSYSMVLNSFMPGNERY